MLGRLGSCRMWGARGERCATCAKGQRTELGRAKAELRHLSAPKSLSPTPAPALCPVPLQMPADSRGGGASGPHPLARSPGSPPSTTSGSATAPPGRQRQSRPQWPSSTLPWWPSPQPSPHSRWGPVPHAPPSQHHVQNTDLGLVHVLISLDPGLEVGEAGRSALHSGAPVRGQEGRGPGAAAQLLPEPTGPGSPERSGPGR